MSEPITIPLTAHQQAFFAELKAQAHALQTQRNAYMSGIVSCTVDPSTLTGSTIDVTATGIVITPKEG